MSSDLILISRAIQKRMDQKDSVSLQDIKRVVQIIGDFVSTPPLKRALF